MPVSLYEQKYPITVIRSKETCKLINSWTDFLNKHE